MSEVAPKTGLLIALKGSDAAPKVPSDAPLGDEVDVLLKDFDNKELPVSERMAALKAALDLADSE